MFIIHYSNKDNNNLTEYDGIKDSVENFYSFIILLIVDALFWGCSKQEDCFILSNN